MKKWQILSSRMAFDNRWMKIRQDKVKLPDGRILDDYFLWLEDDVSMVVPVTKDNEVIMVKQYKHGVQKVMIEYPAGYVDQGETPIQAADRELKEETGYQSKKMELIAKMAHNPTKSLGRSFVFLATDAIQVCDPQTDGLPDDTEDIEVLKLSIEELIKMIHSGRIWAGDSVAATYLVAQKLGW
jgi:ADP-ribose pyrophosphatase